MKSSRLVRMWTYHRDSGLGRGRPTLQFCFELCDARLHGSQLFLDIRHGRILRDGGSGRSVGCAGVCAEQGHD
jgi:hypothetical protein